MFFGYYHRLPRAARQSYKFTSLVYKTSTGSDTDLSTHLNNMATKQTYDVASCADNQMDPKTLA